MCDTIFTFNQSGGHYFQCPSERRHTRLPKKLETLLSQTQISKIYHVALGYNNSFCLTYRDSTGKDHIETRNLPPELQTFLDAQTPSNQPLRSIPNLHIVLGPYNTSFFAHDTLSYRWLNLPAPLTSALQSRIKNSSWTDKPRIVALGSDNNFLLITEHNAAVWDLEHYRTLGQMLEYSKPGERGIEEVRNVVLHPYRFGCFVAVSRNGMVVGEAVAGHEVRDFEGMREAVRRDVEGRERVEMERRNRKVTQHAVLRREWSNTKELLRRDKGEYKLRLSLSLNVSAGGIARMLG